jgi:hypothetical protein
MEQEIDTLSIGAFAERATLVDDCCASRARVSCPLIAALQE